MRLLVWFPSIFPPVSKKLVKHFRETLLCLLVINCFRRSRNVARRTIIGAHVAKKVIRAIMVSFFQVMSVSFNSRIEAELGASERTCSSQNNTHDRTRFRHQISASDLGTLVHAFHLYIRFGRG